MKKIIIIFLVISVMIACSKGKNEKKERMKKNGLELIHESTGYASFGKPGQRMSQYALYYYHDNIVDIKSRSRDMTKNPQPYIPLYQGGPSFETEYGYYNPEKDMVVKEKRKPIEFKKGIPRSDYTFLRKYINQYGPFIYCGEKVNDGKYLFLVRNIEDSRKYIQQDIESGGRQRVLQIIWAVSAKESKITNIDFSKIGINSLDIDVRIGCFENINGKLFSTINKERKNSGDKELPNSEKEWIVKIDLDKNTIIPLIYYESKKNHLSASPAFYGLSIGKTDNEIKFEYTYKPDKEYFAELKN